MRILIVKLSSLGDVVHAMPVVHDIGVALPQAAIDWVVEPGFAPLLQRMEGLDDVLECPLRRWMRSWWTGATRTQFRAFRTRLRWHRYDAILDLQGLTKSALVARLARGVRYGLANRTEGASHERPARWLVDHALRVEPHIHALDRSRELAARALRYRPSGPPDFGLRHPGTAGAEVSAPTVLFIHGTSREDKLWPEADWIALGHRASADGWRIALPHAGAAERARAERIQRAVGAAAMVWPAMSLDAIVDRLGGVAGVIGVDSGLSHVAVALDLPHVQIYNFDTAWRTGPLQAAHQRSVYAAPEPTVDAVWQAWRAVTMPE